MKAALGSSLSDAGRLRILADWFDVHDKKCPLAPSDGHEVQEDLRRIADLIDGSPQERIGKLTNFQRAVVRCDDVVNGRSRGSQERAKEKMERAARAVLEILLFREPTPAEVEEATQP